MRTGYGGTIAATKHLRVLLVEDREDDALLLRIHLEDAGYELDCERVDSLDALAAMLPSGWDLILSDYNLPGFTALDALTLVREHGEDAPFLVMSGQVSEEVAVSAMRAGAQDYIAKQNLARLVPAIERSLQERVVRAERAAATEALRASEERLRLAQAAGQLLAWDWDIASGQVTWSGQCELVYGVSAAELGTSANFLAHMHPDDIAPVMEKIKISLEQHIDFAAEFRACWPDGSTHWISTYGRARFDSSGNAVRMLGINQDITSRKEAEHLSQRLAAIVESAEDAILSKSLEGIIESWNAAAEIMFGYGADEVIGKPMTVIIPEDRIQEEREILSRLRKGERIDHFETLRRTRSGVVVPVALTISPIRDSGGQVVGVSTIARDITRQKQAEAALRRNEKLAAAGRLAASISHEINNPLESVTNLLYLAGKDNELCAETKEFLDTAQKELRRVSHIATHTLRFYRQSTAPAFVDLRSVIESVLALHEGRIRTLQIDVREDVPSALTVTAFEGELRQVLANLVGNAIDAVATRSCRKLVIRASRRARGEQPWVRMIIADTGIGMDESALSRLFEPFYSTKGINGTGLGLWISKEILDRHRARLAVRSRPGVGTAFLIDLPVGLFPTAESEQALYGATQTPTIISSEDHQG